MSVTTKLLARYVLLEDLKNLLDAKFGKKNYSCTVIDDPLL